MSRVTVACLVRIGDGKGIGITLQMDASDVEGLEGAELWEAVRPAMVKELEDLTFEVVEIRED